MVVSVAIANQRESIKDASCPKMFVAKRFDSRIPVSFLRQLSSWVARNKRCLSNGVIPVDAMAGFSKKLPCWPRLPPQRRLVSHLFRCFGSKPLTNHPPQLLSNKIAKNGFPGLDEIFQKILYFSLKR
jgi:hypothetical protein